MTSGLGPPKLSNHRRRSGVVLLLTLAVLTLAVIALAGGARRGLEHAERAAIAEDAFRRRCLLESSRRVFATHAASLLAGGADQPARARRLLRMEGRWHTLSVVLAEESAKAPLRRAERDFSPNQFRRFLAALIRRSSTARPRRRMSPDQGSGWSAVLRVDGAASDAELAAAYQQATERVTLWGGGRINLRVADRQTLLAMLRPRIGVAATQGVLDAARNNPDWPLEQVIVEAEDNAKRQAVLRSLLCDEAAAYSVWTHLSPTAPMAAAAAALDILAVGDDGPQIQESFTW